VAVYRVGRAMRRPVAAVVSAALVVCSPLVVSTLGMEISWTVAWAWIGIASSVEKRWNAQTVALVLMLGTHFDVSMLALATLLSIVRWVEVRRFPVWPALVLAAAALGWWLLADRQIVALFSVPHLSVAEWTGGIRRLADESEFYWLFLPLMGLGVLGVPRRALWAGLLGVGMLVLGGGAAAGAGMATLGLFLAGLGVDWGIEWMEARGVVRLDRVTLAVGLALVAGLVLGMAHGSSLLQRYRFRPVVRQELERQAADWLRAHSEPTATVFGSQRIGYLADRPTLVWDETENDQQSLTLLLQALNENPPEYCVSFRSLAWELLVRTHSFQDGYEPLQEFKSPYGGTSPLTVWGYRLRAFDLGEHRPVPLNVHLPGEVDLVGYQYWPDRIQPGDPVSVTLFLRATRPVTESFYAVVRMISPSDGVDWAQDTTVPRSVLADQGLAGEVIAERLRLTTTADTPVGAYRLEVSAMAPDLESVLPIYRRSDRASLDRLALEAPGRLSPAAQLDVVLYWEALQPPEEDYVVFVHLLDGDGQLVASHDGPPVAGRYPTTTWLPGDIVPDVIRIELDPNTPVGRYRLQAGMYRWPSLERLPVWDSQGIEQIDRVVVLQSVEVE
jgi:hypothetical protein